MKKSTDIGEIFRTAFEDFNPEVSPQGFSKIRHRIQRRRQIKRAARSAGIMVGTVALYLLVRTLISMPEPMYEVRDLTAPAISAQESFEDGSTPATDPVSVQGTETSSAAPQPQGETRAEGPVNPGADNAVMPSSLDPLPAATNTSGSQTIVIESHNSQMPIYTARTSNEGETERPSIVYSPDTVVCYGNQIEISANGGIEYLWGNGHTSNSITVAPLQTTSYSVQVTDNQGYTHTGRILVQVKDCAYLFVPTGFTPNNDGLNDVFQASGREVVDFSLRIYARNGALLFESYDFNKGWNGDVNAEPASEGTYVYVITYVNRVGELVNKKGSITLLR